MITNYFTAAAKYNLAYKYFRAARNFRAGCYVNKCPHEVNLFLTSTL